MKNKFKIKILLLSICCSLLASCDNAPLPPSTSDNSQSEQLGTKWGDEVESSVQTVDLRRISNQPIDEKVLRYADQSFDGREVKQISLADGKIEWSVQNDRHALLPLFRDNGQYYLRGKSGLAYQLVYRNLSGNTYEIVASVDGLDVMTGQAGSRYHSGYVLPPHGSLTIEGFRKSRDAVASFIFSAPESAYAANSDAGSVNNVGVIGTAVFELQQPNPPQTQNTANPFPADNDYAKPSK